MKEKSKLISAIIISVAGGLLFVRGSFAEEVLGSWGPSSELIDELTADKIAIPFPQDFERVDSSERPGLNSNGTNTLSTGTAAGHIKNGVKYIYYKALVWGEVEADFDEFRANIKETLADTRGWMRMSGEGFSSIKFVEVSSGQDVNIILSDPASLEALDGCSGDLSCTTWNNEVIINDVRWRNGTDASRSAGMSTRDYQHMVINHEMGHWLGHYAHETSCLNGGPAPIMLQQSTGLRGCDSFNAWPLEGELWTLR